MARIKEVLSSLRLRGLSEEEQKKLVKSFDIVGDILIIKIHPELESKSRIIGEALHSLFPGVRTIAAVPLYAHTDELYRTRDIEVIWGDENLETTHKESGCIFKVDLSHVFFSPRLAYERMRIARKVLPGETIINMFSGVGCYSIIIAKMQPQAKVYSIDVNPYAYECMDENVRLNRMEGRVIPVMGDVSDELLMDKGLEGVADRVLMPLPERAHHFLPLAVRALKSTGSGTIHYYDIHRGRKRGGEELFNVPIQRARETISSAFGNLEMRIEDKRIVRSVAPRTYHVVLDLRIEKGNR